MTDYVLLFDDLNGYSFPLGSAGTLENAREDWRVRGPEFGLWHPLQLDPLQYPAVGKARETAVYALHVIGRGTLRIVETWNRGHVSIGTCSG